MNLPIQDLDSELEHEIRQAGEEMEAAMSRYWQTNDIQYRGEADRARLRMQELIKLRRPGFVAQMEARNGD